MNVTETAALLRSRNRVLLLTHVRPDGDTIGSAAALCRALRRHRQGGLPPAEPGDHRDVRALRRALLGAGGLGAVVMS